MELGAAPVSDSGTWPLPEASGSFLDEDSEDKDIPKAQTLSIQGSYLVLYAQGQGVLELALGSSRPSVGSPGSWEGHRIQDQGCGLEPRSASFPLGGQIVASGRG